MNWMDFAALRCKAAHQSARLVIQQGDDQEVVGCRFIERVQHPDARPLPVDVNDPVVTPQLTQPRRRQGAR